MTELKTLVKTYTLPSLLGSVNILGLQNIVKHYTVYGDKKVGDHCFRERNDVCLLTLGHNEDEESIAF